MARTKSHKANLVNVTVRVEQEYLLKIKLYSRAVGKNQSESLRELVIKGLLSIPEHTRQVMSIMQADTHGEFFTDATPE